MSKPKINAEKLPQMLVAFSIASVAIIFGIPNTIVILIEDTTVRTINVYVGVLDFYYFVFSGWRVFPFIAGPAIIQYSYVVLCVIFLAYAGWVGTKHARHELISTASFHPDKHVGGMLILGIIALVASIMNYIMPWLHFMAPLFVNQSYQVFSIAGYIVFGVNFLLFVMYNLPVRK